MAPSRKTSSVRGHLTIFIEPLRIRHRDRIIALGQLLHGATQPLQGRGNRSSGEDARQNAGGKQAADHDQQRVPREQLGCVQARTGHAGAIGSLGGDRLQERVHLVEVTQDLVVQRERLLIDVDPLLHRGIIIGHRRCDRRFGVGIHIGHATERAPHTPQSGIDFAKRLLVVVAHIGLFRQTKRRDRKRQPQRIFATAGQHHRLHGGFHAPGRILDLLVQPRVLAVADRAIGLRQRSKLGFSRR